METSACELILYNLFLRRLVRFRVRFRFFLRCRFFARCAFFQAAQSSSVHFLFLVVFRFVIRLGLIRLLDLLLLPKYHGVVFEVAKRRRLGIRLRST